MLPKGTPIYAVHFIRSYMPLSLGMILAYCREQLDPTQFDTTVRFIADMDELEQALAATGPGVFLMSDYMWNVEGHLRASAYIKQHSPESVTVHGGPSVPSYPGACEEYLRKHPFIDFAARGEGEKTTVELLNHLAADDSRPRHIHGLSFLDKGEFVQTPDRTRSTDVNEFPSPYLTGVFEGIYHHANFAVLETYRGCPYGCTFCDWGSATQQKIRQFSMERVKAEIQWISDHKIREINSADSNVGMFERDVEVCRMICEAKQNTGYPERVVMSYAKNTKKHLVEIVEMMADYGLVNTGVISIQSRDPGTLKAIRRSNIKNSEYEKLLAIFREKGLPLQTQLMLGLPGSTVESFKEDLRYYFHGDLNVLVFNTVLLPNSPMAEPSYREQYRIEVDHTDTIISTSTMSREELKSCEDLSRMFRCAHDYGMLRYFLSYLQWDHGVDPLDYLQTLLVDMRSGDEKWARFPLLQRFCDLQVAMDNDVLDVRNVPKDHDPSGKTVQWTTLILCTHLGWREGMRKSSGWTNFYNELHDYSCLRYGLTSSPMMMAALTVQQALVPDQGITYPHEIELAYDYCEYFEDHTKPGREPKRLEDYGPGTLAVDDPFQLSQLGTYRKDWRLADVWQLTSRLPGAGKGTHARFGGAKKGLATPMLVVPQGADVEGKRLA